MALGAFRQLLSRPQKGSCGIMTLVVPYIAARYFTRRRMIKTSSPRFFWSLYLCPKNSISTNREPTSRLAAGGLGFPFASRGPPGGPKIVEPGQATAENTGGWGRCRRRKQN